MIRLRLILAVAISLPVIRSSLSAQQLQGWDIQPLTEEGWVQYDYQTGIVEATNGVRVIYGPVVLTAEQVQVNPETGETIADGNVRIQQAEQLWLGQHMNYNFKTWQME